MGKFHDYCDVADHIEGLETEVERLKRSELDLRQAFLDDPDHDSDAINWALGLLDAYLTYE